MIVLHALWSLPDGLRVWGEAPNGPAAAVRRRRAKSAPRPHPFACSAEALHLALGGEVPEPERCAVLLPTGSNGPLPSPEAAPEVLEGAMAPVRLAPWIVPACPLRPDEALELLFDLDSARGRFVRAGASLVYLAEVAKLALELAARGRLLPSLERQEGGFLARWRPLLIEAADAERLRLLESTMPAACRAALPDDAAGPSLEGWDDEPLPAPGVLLGDALAVLADACAHRALAEVPPAPMRNGAREIPPAARAWLSALTGPDPRVSGDPGALAELEAELDGWLTVPGTTSSATVRLCFRLSEPAEGEEGAPPAGAWRLDFLVQATDDPSLLLPAENVWLAHGRSLAVLGRRLEDPQEWLLGELGRAFRLFPGLEPALRTARPAALELDAAAAHGFLRAAAPLLEQAGFGVLVPPWWRKRDTRLAAQLVARPQPANPSGLLGLEGICEYEWRLALGGEPLLSTAELRELVRLSADAVAE